MNKSYSKIRHIQNVNLILEKRYLNEQLLDKPTDKERIIFFEWLNKKYPKLAEFFRSNYVEEENEDPDRFVTTVWNYEIQVGGKPISLGNLFRKETPLVNRLPTSIPYDVLDRTLAKAKEWWLNWLGSDNTVSKFKKINNLGTLQTMGIWVNYVTIIHSAKYYVVGVNEFDKFDDKTKEHLKNALAWVNNKSTNIYIKMSTITEYKNKEDFLISKFIHEIQHLLYFFYPMNPIKGSNFSFSDGCFEANKKIYNDTKLDYWDKVGTIVGNRKDSIAKDLGIPANNVVKFIDYLVRIAFNYEWKKDYLYQNDSEFLSRLVEARKYFKIPFGGDIGKNQILQYIKTDYITKSQDSVDYILARWVVNNFPPLDNWIKELNSFAERNEPKQKPSPTDLPYQPKTRNV